jgi:hypothetical protein
MKFWQAAGIGGALLVGLANVVGALPWFGLTWPEFRGAIWPAVVAAVLGMLLVVGLIYAIAKARAKPTSPAELDRSVDPSDQRRLDQLFHVLNRDAIRRIKWEDFYIAWPATIMHPVVVYVQELTDVEHTFDDPVLEKLGDDLTSKAATFAHEEAWTSVDHPRLDARRYVGVSQGEADGDPEMLKRLREGAEKILGAATEFTTAHDDLVKAAKDRGYNLDALGRDRHPRVRDLDEIYEPEQRRSWSDAPAPPWPGGPGPSPT